MKGIKYILLGIAFILVGGFILIDTQSNLGGFGEIILFIIGLGFGFKGLINKDWNASQIPVCRRAIISIYCII